MAAKRRARCGFRGSGVAHRSGNREEFGRVDCGLVGKRTTSRSDACPRHERNGCQTANGRATSAGRKTAASDVHGGLFGFAGRDAGAGTGDCGEDPEAGVVYTELACRVKCGKKKTPGCPPQKAPLHKQEGPKKAA